MLAITRTLHVLAVSLWFGTAVFFTFVVGLSLFGTFEQLTDVPKAERPLWLPLPPELDKPRPSDRFPEPLSREQGNRIAGAAVGPMFTPYYLLQLACGVVALLSAVAWVSISSRRRLETLRCVLLMLALVGAGVGWWLAEEVHDLRVERSRLSDAVLLDPSPSSEALRDAETVRADFGRWHGYSLIVNLTTIALVTGVTAMAAHLPATLPGGRD